MTRTAPIWLALLILGPLHGQTMVEAGALMGGAGMTTAPAMDVGKALQNLLKGSLANLPAPGANPATGAKPATIPTGSPMIGDKSLADMMVGLDFSGTRDAVTGAPSQDPGNAFGGYRAGMGKRLESMPPRDPSVTVVPPEKMATPKADGRFYEDPKWIPPGMSYEDLMHWFGPPSMEMTLGPGHKSLMYTSKDGIPHTVELVDGKVAGPEALTPKPKPAAAPREYVVMNVRQ